MKHAKIGVSLTNNWEPLTQHTWLKLKNTFARQVYKPQSIHSLIDFLNHNQLPYLFLGNGSNTLLDTFDGVVIKTDKLRGIEFIKDMVIVEAGVQPMRLINASLDRGVGGFEFMCTIPGTIAGMVKMNAGAHGDCMANHVAWVEVLEHQNGVYKRRIIRRNEIEFAYRHSSIMDPIVRIALNTEPVQRPDVEPMINGMQGYINAVQPRSMTLGSTFKNPEGKLAWKLIETLDEKYLKSENAFFSPLHRNFIINSGNATAREIYDLITTVREKVAEKYGIFLELEIKVYLDDR